MRPFAPVLIAVGARGARAAGIFGLVLLLSACAGLVDKPTRPTLYDLGPVSEPAAAPRAAQRALVLADLEASGTWDGSAILYRLVYADAHQLRAYSQARWSAPPPQLLRQRLRDVLGRERVVLNLGESAALAREGGVQPRVLRLELEEFSHVFDTPVQSHGAVRLRATLLQNTAAGERLLGQRSISVQRTAATPDAAGGVRALSQASEAAAAELSQWLQQAR
jgi:cholesterol transport system auxiliary component